MSAKIIEFPKARAAVPAPSGPLPLAMQVAVALDMVAHMLTDGTAQPDCFFLMYGATVPDTSERVWNYLAMQFTEVELRQAMEKIYADMRSLKDV